jgi:hypothetical protein
MQTLHETLATSSNGLASVRFARQDLGGFKIRFALAATEALSR